jgi:hypothetical protein
MKQYLAELIGTFVLVFGCASSKPGPRKKCGARDARHGDARAR